VVLFPSLKSKISKPERRCGENLLLHPTDYPNNPGGDSVVN